MPNLVPSGLRLRFVFRGTYNRVFPFEILSFREAKLVVEAFNNNLAVLEMFDSSSGCWDGWCSEEGDTIAELTMEAIEEIDRKQVREEMDQQHLEEQRWNI